MYEYGTNTALGRFCWTWWRRSELEWQSHQRRNGDKVPTHQMSHKLKDSSQLLEQLGLEDTIYRSLYGVRNAPTGPVCCGPQLLRLFFPGPWSAPEGPHQSASSTLAYVPISSRRIPDFPGVTRVIILLVLTALRLKLDTLSTRKVSLSRPGQPMPIPPANDPL